jgi:hypothetical protein
MRNDKEVIAAALLDTDSLWGYKIYILIGVLIMISAIGISGL